VGDETGTPQAAAQDRPAGELVKDLSEQMSRLVRDELRLAQLEVTRKGRQAGLGLGLLGGGGILAWYGLGCLIACAIIAVATAVTAWLAALIIGAALLLLSAVAALLGKTRLARGVPPVPTEAISSVKTDVEELKERAHR
jgi:Putative Actinobacterial Holin-X, holin superfamily III